MHPFAPFVTEAVWQELVNLGLADGLLFTQQIEKNKPAKLQTAYCFSSSCGGLTVL